MNHDDQVVATLHNAATSLEVDGWLQQHAGGGLGPRCVSQALYDCATDHGMAYNRVYAQAMEALKLHVRAYDVVAWNDELGRTADEVITALRETADEVKARQDA